MPYKPSRLAVTKLVGHMSEQHDDPQIERIQNGLEQDKWDLNTVPFNVRDGVLKTFYNGTGRTLPSSFTVPTGLARPMRGWIIVRKTTSGDIWETSSDDKSCTVTMSHTLASGPNNYVKVWFY